MGDLSHTRFGMLISFPHIQLGLRAAKEIVYPQFSNNLLNDYSRLLQNAFSSHLQAVSCFMYAKKSSLSSSGMIGSSGIEKVCIILLFASILKVSIIGCSP